MGNLTAQAALNLLNANPGAYKTKEALLGHRMFRKATDVGGFAERL